MVKKILIVDDSPVARAIVKKCLPKDHDFELSEAGDGQAGVQKFKEVRPDLTLLDLTMPVMDGFGALEAIKKEDCKAVVVVLTSDIQKKTVAKVMELGADLVLAKPPSAESIQEALTTAARILEG